jgi:hypothetical protein
MIARFLVLFAHRLVVWRAIDIMRLDPDINESEAPITVA